MSAPENRAQLIAEIMTNLASGQPGGITALQLQAVLEDVVNSVYNLVDTNASVLISYTGTPVTPFPLLITPQSVYVPASAGSGAPTIFQQSAEAPFQVGFDYEEGLQTTSIPTPGIGITSISFNDMVSGSSVLIIGCGRLASISFPALLDSGIVHITSCPALTVLSLPNFVQTTLTPLQGNFGSGDFLVTFCPLLTTISLPSLTTIGGGIGVGAGGFGPSQLTGLTTLSCPNLAVVNGLFIPATFAVLTNLSFPSLTMVTSQFAPAAMPLLTTFSFPVLTTIGGAFAPATMASLTSLSMPSLTFVGGAASITGMAALATASFPAMAKWGGTITMSTGLGNLANVTLGTNGTLKAILGATINISGQKLTAASVNAILSLLVTLDGTNGTTLWGAGMTLTINGGTNAAPSGQGITDKATLIARGATVTTN